MPSEREREHALISRPSKEDDLNAQPTLKEGSKTREKRESEEALRPEIMQTTDVVSKNEIVKQRA